MTSYNPGQRLCETNATALGQRVPEPLHARLAQLEQLVYDAGHQRPTKARLLAALVLAAPSNPVLLVDALAAYDRACVADALLGDHDHGEVVSLPRRKPGPKTGRPRLAAQ